MAPRTALAALCCLVAFAAANAANARSLNQVLLTTTPVAARPATVVVTRTTPVVTTPMPAAVPPVGMAAPMGAPMMAPMGAPMMAPGAPVVPPPPHVCSNARSVPIKLASGTGSRWRGDMSGTKNIKPNTTGVAAPMPGPPKGTFEVTIDEVGQKATWTLTLCDVPQYIASHLHSGSPKADYPPPLVPLEPFVKPANPFGPPTSLPLLCPPVDIVGCSYTKTGSFIAADITPLPGKEPQGDKEVPKVANWSDFLKALKAGDIYVNVHSLKMPAGLIRANLAPQKGAPVGPAAQRKP